MLNTSLPLAQTPDQIAFWNRLQPVNRVTASDTYKRTMSGSGAAFADNFAVYSLAARRALKEDGVNGRLIMAGMEKMLYPWFMNPFTEREIDTAQRHFTHTSKVRHIAPIWETILDNDGYMPIDIYALPGGQTFLAKDGKYVPMMSVEGPGSLVTHLEPHLESIFAPQIQATKARLFLETCGKKVVEFGLRADQNENNHVTLMIAVLVGGGINRTSDDQACFLFPEYFSDVGTVGHEYIMSFQRKGMSLEDAQMAAYEEFVAANQVSALLPDVIHTINSGLPAILKMVKKYKGTNKIIMPRLDSGDILAQGLHWKKMTLDAYLPKTQMVVEDGFNPVKGQEVKAAYAAAGYDPEEITIGAGGYFQDGTSRDGVSLVYKRSATMHDGRLEESMKFSDSPGKGSIPGQIRIYGRGNTMIVAQASENIDGVPLMQKVVSNGRIVYDEDLNVQSKRAEQTWDQYAEIEYSPLTQQIIAERTAEYKAIVNKVS